MMNRIFKKKYTWIYFRGLLLGFFHRSRMDRLVGLSAEIVYYEFFAIFPFLIFCVNCLALLPSEGLILMFIAKVAPAPTVALFKLWLATIQKSSGLTLLSVSAVMSLWVGSAGVGSFIEAFAFINRNVSKTRLFKRIAMRMIFTAVGAIGLLLMGCVWVIGPTFLQHAFAIFGLSRAWTWTWGLIYMPLAAALIALSLMVFYHCLSFSGRRFRDHWPGTLLATAALCIASAIFSVYVRSFSNFDATFGSLGAIMMLLLWLQTINISILVGEFWNVEIQHQKTNDPALHGGPRSNTRRHNKRRSSR